MLRLRVQHVEGIQRSALVYLRGVHLSNGVQRSRHFNFQRHAVGGAVGAVVFHRALLHFLGAAAIFPLLRKRLQQQRKVIAKTFCPRLCAIRHLLR